MRSNSLTIFSVTVILLFTVHDYSIAAPNDFTVLVNNSPTQSGNPVLVPSGSTVYFEIGQSSNLPIHVDPTGKGEVDYSLNGTLARFTTAYNAGNYNPIIKVGDKTKTLQLIAGQEKDSDGLFKLISDLSWPLLILIVFIVLACWEGLRLLILRINEMEVAGVRMRASDLGSRMTAALDKAIDTINMKLPKEVAGRFLPAPLSYDIAYHIHIFEFIHDIGSHPGNVNVWNAVGNFYFAKDSTKAEIAYSRAIEQDKNNPDAYANLGMLHLMQKKDRHTAKGYYTTALELADKMHTVSAVAHLGMVVLSSHEGNKENERLHCEEAKKIFQRLVSIDNTDFWSLFFLGWCWSYGDSNLDKAIEYTSSAVKYAPDFLSGWYNLACFYALKKEPQKSIEALKKITSPARQALVNANFEKDRDWDNIASSSQFRQFCDFMGLSYNGTTVLEDGSGGPETE